jgi:hypothetical protein
VRVRTVLRVLLSIVMGLAVALSASAAEAPGHAEQQQRKLTVPGDQALAIMIKTTLIAFNDANRTGNYSVLRDLAAPSFREANTSAQLAEIFQGARHSNLDLAPIVLFQPQLVRKPVIDRGLLQLSGYFATRPEQVQFDLAFQEVDGYWRLFGIHVTAHKVVEVPTARNDQPTDQREPAGAVGTPAGSKTVVAIGRSADLGIPTGPASLMEPPLPTLKPESKQ